MQIHELNTFTQIPGNASFLAIDNGFDTGKISSTSLLSGPNEEIEKLNSYKVNIPIDGNDQPTNGTNGQLLRTKGDGGTEWVDVGLPTDEQTEAAITAWLDDHPEATTTVQDGSITKAKLHSTLRVTADMFINDETELADAINNPQYKAYFLGDIVISAPIEIEHNRDASKLTFIGGHIVLNTALFDNASIVAGSQSASWAIPNFVGTYFERGSYDTIFTDGFYTLFGHFTSCHFLNISFVRASIVVQSPRFEGCFFIADAETPAFIHANAVYDAKFTDCDWEANYVPILINVEKDTTWGSGGGSTMRQVSFVNCISEGRSANLVRFNDGDVEFYSHYAEGNSAPIVDVYKAAYQTYQFHSINFFNSFLNTASANQHVVLIEEDYNYENTSFVCIGCQINGCILVNTNKFLRYVVEGCKLVGNAKVYPSRVMSKAGAAYEFGGTMGRSYTNGIGFFKSNSRTIYVMPEISLITFNSVYSESTTPFVVVAGTKTSGASPGAFAYCISHPEVTITAVYNSTLGLVELTLPNELGVINTAFNASAVGLRRIYNDATGIDYYRSVARDGYTPLDVKEIFTT